MEDIPWIWVVEPGATEPVCKSVFVVSPTRAYNLIQDITPKVLSHGGPAWGNLYVGYILPRRESDSHYEQPTEETVQRVAIKRLDMRVVGPELARGSFEDPYKEIRRMYDIGDNFHVLRCIEHFEHDHFLYIITPYCSGHSLTDHIPLTPGPQGGSIERQAREIFRQMLEDVEYMHEQHGLCHADIDPGNFLLDSRGRVMLSDLAMSFPIPPGDLTEHMGFFGKPPYWAPELFFVTDRDTGEPFRDPTTREHVGRPFYARKRDLWACVVTLFNLLTEEQLCKQFPYPGDIRFRYLVLAGGLSQNVANERALEVLDDPSTLKCFRLDRIARKILTLTPQVLELFENTLRMRPEERWTIEEIIRCEWMNMHLP
jgi:serine/threonine protein kinase